MRGSILAIERERAQSLNTGKIVEAFAAAQANCSDVILCFSFQFFGKSFT